MVAWYKLVRVWASLRFDDHRGLDPRSLMLTSTGWSGTLTQTKTSGAGKAREELPLFVSASAYLARAGWFSAGWGLWSAVDPSRDYFLSVPQPHLEGMRAIEAKYQDGVAIFRALLTKAELDGGALLVLPAALKFWTEQSPRACVHGPDA